MPRGERQEYTGTTCSGHHVEADAVLIQNLAGRAAPFFCLRQRRDNEEPC